MDGMKVNLVHMTMLISTVAMSGPIERVAFGADAARTSKKLRVSQNHRYLEYEDGSPFFYLGDTAWELFHRLNREEADRYLANRAAKGFTVIQAVVLAELDGLKDPNPYGDTPLADSDPTKPNEAYFRHVDTIVNKAQELGLFVGMLPTWGNRWKRGGIFTPENAEVYGQFLGRRYRDKPIIWILGGDHNPDNDRERAIIESMAHGLKDGDGGNHLITYHPRGPGLSSDYWHKADWLDFNMYQSSHAARDHDNGLFAEHDYALEPPKPTLDGEPRYEMITVGFYNANADPDVRFDAYDVRQAAYWSLLAGACGHTYGHGSVWQMWQPGRKPVLWASTPWQESLDHPGASQMGHVRRLFESRPFHRLVPDQSIVLDGPDRGGAKIRAARASDGSFAFIYSPRGEQFTIRMSVIRTPRIRQTWFDPRDGTAKPLHTTDTPGIQTFVPPTSGRDNDWILVLDDATAGFPLPGQPRE
jgi:hypothetical protein